MPEIIKSSLEYLEVKNYVEWQAYVIMPDHVHLLFSLKEPEPLSKLIQKFSQFTSRQIGLLYRERNFHPQDSSFSPGIGNRSLSHKENQSGLEVSPTEQLSKQGGIWQEGYFDRAIRNEEELQKAFAYIQNNPVKAGYVQDKIDWPWLFPKD